MGIRIAWGDTIKKHQVVGVSLAENGIEIFDADNQSIIVELADFDSLIAAINEAEMLLK